MEDDVSLGSGRMPTTSFTFDFIVKRILIHFCLETMKRAEHLRLSAYRLCVTVHR